MKKNFLGNTGIEVSEVGFGVLPIGPSQLALPVETGAAILRYALEQGINFLDTAQYYRTYPYIRHALKDGSFDDVVQNAAHNVKSAVDSVVKDETEE